MPDRVRAPDLVLPSWQYAVAVTRSVSPARAAGALRRTAASGGGVEAASAATIPVRTTAIDAAICISPRASSRMPWRPAEPAKKDEHEGRGHERSPPSAKTERAERIGTKLRDHEHDRACPCKRAHKVQH